MQSITTMELTLKRVPNAPDIWLSSSPENLDKFGQSAMRMPRSLAEQRHPAGIVGTWDGVGEL